MATSGTHDTEPMVTWWDEAPAEEKEAVLAIPSVRARLGAGDRVRDALIESLAASGADLVVLPIQDVFGWQDRINQPATVRDSNWTWRLPWPVERMWSEPEAVGVAARLNEWSSKYGRNKNGSPFDGS